jgi:AraC-like DNA-binding protein
MAEADHAANDPLGPAPDREASIRDGLRCLQLSGSVFLRAHLSAPWAYVSRSAADLDSMLRTRGERIIVFHVITQGSCRISIGDGVSEDLVAGDVAILPFADQHVMGDPSLEGAVPLLEILPDPANTPELRYGGGGPVMSMICGYLRSDDLPLNPVLASLPPLIRVPTAGGPLGHWVDASVEYALHTLSLRSPVSDPLLARLPELMITECLCAFASKGPGADQGWLAGLADPVVGRALACIHREPELGWTLKDLAKRAAASRSVLAERFQKLIGQAPMSYLTAFRLQLAGRQLRTSSASMAEVAGAVGYASEASFSRAFKRHVGVSPSEWRKSA